MSRSKKKNPIIGICCCDPRSLKKAKNEMTKWTRRELNAGLELSNGSSFKKISHSWQWRPDDGKQYWNNPKAYRK